MSRSLSPHSCRVNSFLLGIGLMISEARGSFGGRAHPRLTTILSTSRHAGREVDEAGHRRVPAHCSVPAESERHAGREVDEAVDEAGHRRVPAHCSVPAESERHAGREVDDRLGKERPRQSMPRRRSRHCPRSQAPRRHLPPLCLRRSRLTPATVVSAKAAGPLRRGSGPAGTGRAGAMRVAPSVAGARQRRAGLRAPRRSTPASRRWSRAGRSHCGTPGTRDPSTLRRRTP